MPDETPDRVTAVEFEIKRIQNPQIDFPVKHPNNIYDDLDGRK